MFGALDDDGAQRSVEDATENDPLMLATLRVQEWRAVKDLQEMDEEVEVEIDLSDEADVSYTQVPNGPGRGFWKKAWKRVKRIVKPLQCRVDTKAYFIPGVDESAGDDWTKKVAVLNDDYGYCSPISAAMVLRYQGLTKNIAALYQEPQTEPEKNLDYKRRDDPWDFSNNGNYMLFKLLLSGMGTSRTRGTLSWNIDDGITKVFRHYNISGNARWIWWKSTGGLFDMFEDEIKHNRPAIVNVGGHAGWPVGGGWLSGHSMPVIGTKKASYRWTCMQPDRHWLYVHTTWGKYIPGDNCRKSNLCFSNKRWYRFDSLVHPLAIWDGVQIRVH